MIYDLSYFKVFTRIFFWLVVNREEMKCLIFVTFKGKGPLCTMQIISHF